MKTMMLGAMVGDIAGSIYEHHNIKHEPLTLVDNNCYFTDDTVLTMGVAEGIMNGLEQSPEDWLNNPETCDNIRQNIHNAVHKYARMFPNAGYGGRFRGWMYAEDPHPYNSMGNGSAMRASFCGWAANSVAESLKLAELSAEITHNHPSGIKGAQVVAHSIYLLRQGISKDELKEVWSNYYRIDFTLDEICDSYTFSSGCNGSVPQALEAFYEGDSFEKVLKLAISIGGDSDTIAAIAGSLAEICYEIPEEICENALSKLKAPLIDVLLRISDKYNVNNDIKQFMI